MKNSLLNKPAFRYIFEIIVIVFSVTLSFYIQDVLNDREKIELKNNGLSGVLSDLNNDLDFFTYGEKKIQNTSHYIDSIINPNSKISNHTINNGTKRYFGFIGRDGNFNSIVSTGAIEYIANDELSQKINQYYVSYYSLLKDYARQDEENYKEIVKYLNNNYSTKNLEEVESGSVGVDFVYDNSSNQKMKIDRVLKNFLLQKKWGHNIYLSGLRSAIEINKSLQKLIQSELTN